MTNEMIVTIIRYVFQFFFKRVQIRQMWITTWVSTIMCVLNCLEMNARALFFSCKICHIRNIIKRWRGHL